MDHRAALLMLLTLSWTAGGCDDSSCATDADCPSGQICVDSTCRRPGPNDDARAESDRDAGGEADELVPEPEAKTEAHGEDADAATDAADSADSPVDGADSPGDAAADREGEEDGPCEPSCAGRCAGADNGCGSPCPANDCPTICCGTDCCRAGETCGLAGQCCRPLSCAELAYDCGAADDGCGGEIDCGNCSGCAGQCLDHRCQPFSMDRSSCHQGDVWWFDSCGNAEFIREDCGSATCIDGACCEPDCASHDACGLDGCGHACGTCDGDRFCFQDRYCVWDHGNNGSETCNTICAWGHSSCVGTSSYDCGTKGVGGIDCYCW